MRKPLPARGGAGPDPAPSSPPAPASPDKPIVLAVVTGAHGVTGEVRLKVFAEDLGAYRSFNRATLTLSSLRHASTGAIARFAEIKDRDAAEALRGVALTVPRDELPPLAEDEYYHTDLIGLPVETDTGDPVGRTVAVENFGAGDILEIERPDGKRFMVPMQPAAVLAWDGQRIVLADAFVERT